MSGPFRQYQFLGCAVGRGYGGLEHRASSGLIGTAAYLRDLAKNLTRIYQTPGRLGQSLAEASFNAWDKFYKPGPDALSRRQAWLGA